MGTIFDEAMRAFDRRLRALLRSGVRLEAVLALLLVVVAGVTSCRGHRTRAGADSETQPARRAPVQRPAAVPGPLPAVAPPESPWFPPLDWSERRAPEDFRIGPLETGGSEDAAYRKLDAVCAGLVQGKVETGSIDPTRAAGLSERLADQLERGGKPSDYRIGRLQVLPDGSAWARVRFFLPAGSVEGEAYLTLRTDGWFVTDMQIDLSMAKAGPKREEPFLPSPYRDRTD